MVGELPQHEWRDIAGYVEGQTSKGVENPDDPKYKVTLVQKVADYRVAGKNYDVYDVHLPDERWWVIAPMTNLYAQEHFPQYDMAFTFHLGLTFRIMEQSRTEMPDDERTYVGQAWRRYEAAVAAMETAEEAEDFQAIGIACREALLAVVRQHQNEDWFERPETPPKGADFKGWSKVFAEALSSGRQRSYLVSLSDKTWDLAVSLQHDSNATEYEAEILLDATANLLGTYAVLLTKHEKEPPRRCPRCGSYRFSEAGDIAERDGQEGWLRGDVCSACGFKGHETFDPFEWDDPDESPVDTD